MKISTLQWNIGGAKIRTPDSDPTNYDIYKQEGLEHIIAVIKECKPDIVTLQETHASPAFVQAMEISMQTGLPNKVNVSYDRSHIDKQQDLGQAVLSRFPITRYFSTKFLNPKYEITRPNGEVWISHDKGITECELKIENKMVIVYSLHLIPFQYFEVDHLGERAKELRADIAKKLKIKSDCLIQGDFNIDGPSLKEFMPEWFKAGLQEILQDAPTRPKGQSHDHVLYKGLKLKSSKVIESVLTDHFPIYSEFEI